MILHGQPLPEMQSQQRGIPYKSSLIDSSEYRYQSGNDLYLSRIIKGALEPEDITSIAQAHRKMRDTLLMILQ